MAVELTKYFKVLRAVLGDRDKDIPIYDDDALADMIIAVINLNEVPGYSISDDELEVVASALQPSQGYVERGYQFDYGYNYSFAYANRYNTWYDQGFMYYLNYTPPAPAPGAGDLTPSGNPDAYATLIWKVAQLFIASVSNSHFKTRAFAEAIQAPAELVWLIQQKVYDIENGVQSSARPAPLPMVAIGVRSLWSGLWTGNPGLSWGSFGYDLAAF